MAQAGEISGIGWTGGLKWLALVVLMPIVLVVTPVLAVLGGFVVYHNWVSSYAATYTIAVIPAKLRLRFHTVWDETTDSGRYLTIATPRLTRTLKLCGFDWIHNSRTSVYLTEARDIAVLGPQGCDYIFNSVALETKSPFGVASDAWSYLGAFGGHFYFVEQTL